MRKARLLWGFFVVAATCFGQGIPYQSNVFTSANYAPPGSQTTMFTVPFATITVCGATPVGNPCTNTVVIYSNATMSVTAHNPITADVHGRFNFWAPSGIYSYNVKSADGTNFGNFYLSLGGSGGGSAISLQHNGTAVANQNVLNFNDTTPAAPSGNVNVTFGSDSTGKLSAWVPISASSFTLTTTGTSGPATYASSVLNIPDYTYTLTVPKITALGTLTNDISGSAAKWGGIAGSGTPSVGQVPVATGSGTATWQTISATGGISGQTTNCVLKANTATSSNASAAICDNGATITATEPVAVTVAGGQGGTADLTEGTAATTTAGHDVLYADSTSHCIKYSTNGGAFGCLGASGSSAFNAITSGTNTTAAMVIGSGASLAPAGTGTIQATNIASTIAAGTNVTVAGSGTTASPYTISSSGSGSSVVEAPIQQICPGAVPVDPNTGLTLAGGAGTDVKSCVNTYLSTNVSPTQKVIVKYDATYVGAPIMGPAMGNWGISGLGAGIGRVKITAVTGASGTCTFTTLPQALVANQTVQIGGTGTVLDGGTTGGGWVKVSATGLSSTSFQAACSYTGTASALTAEADYLYGTGIYVPNGTNDDAIRVGGSTSAGGCTSGNEDAGWISPAPATSIGANVSITGILVNGNRYQNNGTAGNSTSNAWGVGTFPSTLYSTSSPYCFYKNINVQNTANVLIDHIVSYNAPAFNIKFDNTMNTWVKDSAVYEVFPNQTATPHFYGDGIHYSGPNQYGYVDNTTIYATDDAVAYNAPEGHVGLINHMHITNSTFGGFSISGVRAYTGSIAPPAGDATPLIGSDMTADNYSGSAAQAVGLFGLFSGSRTFTVANSVNYMWSDSHVSGKGLFMLDDNFGTLTFNNVQSDSSTCVDGNGFLSTYQNSVTGGSLNLSNVRINRTSSGNCTTSIINSADTAYGGSAAGQLHVAQVNLNSIAANDVDGGSYSVLANVFNLSGSSSIGSVAGQASVDYSHITSFIPKAQNALIGAYASTTLYVNNGQTGGSATGTPNLTLVNLNGSGAKNYYCGYFFPAGVGSPINLDTFDVSINRNCATGSFDNTSNNAAFFEMWSSANTQSSAFLVATTPTENSLPAYELKVGAGVMVGSSAIGSVASPGADPGEGNLKVSGSVDSGTGFKIGGAAPSGHCLVGNGTAYVDGACGAGGSSIVASAEVVASSATPTFSTSTNVSRTVLTGNITSFTLGAGADGQDKKLCFKQGAGPYTVTPPAGVHGFFTIGTTNGGWNCQSFAYDSTDSIWLATGPGATNE